MNVYPPLNIVIAASVVVSCIAFIVKRRLSVVPPSQSSVKGVLGQDTLFYSPSRTHGWALFVLARSSNDDFTFKGDAAKASPSVGRPALITASGKTLDQCGAIARHIANKAGLRGDTLELVAFNDMLIEEYQQVYSILESLLRMQNTFAGVMLEVEVLTVLIPQHLKKLENLVGSNGQFSPGVHRLLLSKEAFDHCPKIAAFYARNKHIVDVDASSFEDFFILGEAKKNYFFNFISRESAKQIHL